MTSGALPALLAQGHSLKILPPKTPIRVGADFVQGIIKIIVFFVEVPFQIRPLPKELPVIPAFDECDLARFREILVFRAPAFAPVADDVALLVLNDLKRQFLMAEAPEL